MVLSKQTRPFGKKNRASAVFPIGVPGISIRDGKLREYPVANCSAPMLVPECLVTPQKESTEMSAA